jgi:serine/threonine protein kinase/phosphoribosyl 1,2-cyclic phosphodiesterase/tetratricopeptide (TPR) repeat protein/anti-anti-sigma regulatory factor
MRIRFWGVRGSIPSPISSQAIEEKIVQAILGMPDIDWHDEAAVRAYVSSLHSLQRGTAGGNTTCIEIQSGEDTIILDAGSGLRELGLELMKGPCGQGRGTLHLVFTHCHWDHIQGFPFFTPAFVPGNRLIFYGVHNVRKALEHQQSPLTFPVRLSFFKANREYVSITPGEPFTIGRLRLNALRNIHPGESVSYRIEDQHSTLVFATDAEYKDLDEAHLQPYIDFYRDADLLIFDAQYTLRDVWQKVDWGHSSALIGVDLARAARVKKLVLFHHDPTYSDNELMGIQSTALAYQSQDLTTPTCDVVIGQEGLTIDLTPRGAADLQMVSDGEVAILTPFDGQDGIEQAIRQLVSLDGEQQNVLTSSILDLANVETLTIPSLKTLISLRQKFKDAPIVLVAPSAKVQQVIELAGYRDYFVIYPSLESALAALSVSETLNLPGQVIQGRYQIQEKIYSDHWVHVLKAADLQTGEVVALKILSPSFQLSTLDRLAHQVERMSGCDHPNLVKIYGWGREGEYAYIVEEFVNAPTLQEMLDSGDMPASIEEASQTARNLVRALEYLHSLGIVHGGFSLRNVFITKEGAKLGGFGLGRLVEGHNLLETPPLILSVDYLSPEQLLGQSLDARTDLYSLGVVLYQLFTGAMPFEVSEQDLNLTHFDIGAVPPRNRNPLISLSLEHLILRLLSKNPNSRYASAIQVSRIWDSLSASMESPAQLRLESFFGRQKELDDLQQLWDAARSGRGQLVFISGGRGIGKTRLAHQAAVHSKASVVLTGSCQEGNTQAYRLFADILRSYFGTVPPELDDAIACQLLQNFTRIVPELQQVLPDCASLPLLAPEHEQLRLMSSLVQFIRHATRERPWILILEDLHWIDPSSLELFSYLGRHISSLSLLVIGTYSDVELERGHPFLEALRDLSRHPGYSHIALDSLTPAEVEEMLVELWEQPVPADLVEKLYTHTEGNPFYVEEIAKALVDDGLVVWENGVRRFPTLEQISLPASAQDTIRRRIARLSPDTLNLLQHAAVLGKTFQFDVLQEMMGLPKWEVLEHLDMALERQLVREIPGKNQLSFQQAEVQQLLYEDISPLRRRLLHRQAGEVLERRAMPMPEQIAAELAHHFEESGDLQKALKYYLEAAHQAKVAFANETAVLWYNRALEIIALYALTDEGSLQSNLLFAHKNIGEVLALLGRYDEALSHYNVFLAIAGTVPPSDERSRQLADVCRLVASVHDNRSEYDQAFTWLEKGLSYLDKSEPVPELVYIYDLIGWVQIRQGQYRAARVPLRHALQLAQVIQLPQVEIDCLRNLGTACWFLGEDEDAKAYWERSLHICQEIGDRHGEGKVLNNLGLLCRDQGDYMLSKEYYEQTLLIAQETGNRLAESIALNNLGYSLRSLGDYEQAQVSLERSLSICEDIGARQTQCMALSNLGLLAHYMGDNETALNYGGKAQRIAKEVGAHRDLADALLCLGHAQAAMGNFPQAADAYQQLINLQNEMGMFNLVIDALAGRAQVALIQGNLSLAQTYVSEILHHMEEKSLDDSDDPLRVYLIIYRVLVANQDDRALKILEQSQALLNLRLSQISDPVLQRMYLENNPAHQSLLSEWKRLGSG